MDTRGNHYSNTNFNQEPEPMFSASTRYLGEDEKEVQMKEDDGKPYRLVIVMSLYWIVLEEIHFDDHEQENTIILPNPVSSVISYG